MHGLITAALIWHLLWAAIILLAQVDVWNPLNWALVALLATTATCLLVPHTPQSGGRRSGRLRIT